MGSCASKEERSSALLLCKGRLRHLKRAVDARYALSAAQLSYEQSLRNVGIALRQFVEAHRECDPEKSPAGSSYDFLSPSPLPDHADLPVDDIIPSEPRHSGVSYMRSMVSTPLRVTVDLSETSFKQEGQSISPALPPPSPPHLGSSWDFFDPDVAINNVVLHSPEKGQSISLRRFKDLSHSNGRDLACTLGKGIGNFEGEELDRPGWEKVHENDNCPKSQHADCDKIKMAYVHDKVDEPTRSCSVREGGQSDFSTHRSKDFLFSVKETENLFTRAAESCHEVSRMLEIRKIRLSISSQTIGKSSDVPFLSDLFICCKGGTAAFHESGHHTKVITWKHSLSSQSSSSRNPLVSAPKDDDPAESGCDFVEEFCMISGSHSATLDRLYAWERKLYDELKASESLKKVYNKNCAQLRNQFARDMASRRIDKTRATVKDLHARLMVGTEALYSISKRIEKLRDEELYPQLVELVQGLMRMWRIMQEIHQAQHAIISLPDTNISLASPPRVLYKQLMMNLISEIDCFICSFTNWGDVYKCYVDALHSWLQKCILQPQESSRGRKVTFSPRRHLAPPIFVLLRDWSTGITSLPSEEACDFVKNLAADLQKMVKHQSQEKPENKKPSDTEGDINTSDGSKDIESKVAILQANLTTMFDRLAKFSKTMTNLCENVKQENEQAQEAYTNGQFSKVI